MFIIFLILFVPVHCDINPNLITDFLREQHLKICILFTCESEGTTIDLMKTAHQQSVYLGAANIRKGVNDINFDRLFRFVNNPVAVLIDLNCNGTADILREVSRRTYFHQRYHWLMFSMNESVAREQLSSENINFDAEITLAVPVASS